MDTRHRDEVAVVLPESVRRLRGRLVEQRPDDEKAVGLSRLAVDAAWCGTHSDRDGSRGERYVSDAPPLEGSTPSVEWARRRN
jgi:hypothetical protein